jgi:subtilisin-like proprotein convertase family protein
VLQADDTTKSGVAVGEAEGGDWRLEVEDDKKNWVGGLIAQSDRIAD